MERPKDTEKELKKALELDPKNLKYNREYFQLLEYLGKKKEAKKFEEELISIDNEYAEKYFEERLKEDENNAEFNHQLAKVKWGRSKVEEAQKYFKRAIELDMEEEKYYIRYGKFLYDQQRYK